MTIHPLFKAFREFRGNARAAVLTEPLWGIPYNLFISYLSIYMLALGLDDREIGLVASIGLAFQILTAWLSGAITDKLGRRRTTLIFDTLAWGVPCVVWAASQNVYWFAFAAIMNSFWRMGMNSWPLLLAEDTDPALLADIYSWTYIFAVSASLFTPLTGVLVQQMTLVPALRLVFGICAVIMTAKFLLQYFMSHETAQGKVRMEQTRGQHLFTLLSGYGLVFRHMQRAPQTMFTLAILIINTICNMVSNTFWSVLVTQKLQLPPQWISAFPFARAIFVLIFFFTILPLLRNFPFRIPMMAAYAGFILSQFILVSMNSLHYGWLIFSVFLEACSYACISPQIDRLMFVTTDPQERARIISIMWMGAILVSTPFGWIAGELSELNRIYPFLLSMGLLLLGGILVYISTKKMPELA